MTCNEVDAGDFRIRAGAIEQPYGYVASVVVLHKDGHDSEAWRDDHLAGGFTWATPDEAVRFALNAGHDAVMCGIGGLR